MGLRGWFSPRRSEQPETARASAMLPAEVVAVVQAARIFANRRPDAEGNQIVTVQAPALGRFRWQDPKTPTWRGRGLVGAAPRPRFSTCWPGLSHVGAVCGWGAA